MKQIQENIDRIKSMMGLIIESPKGRPIIAEPIVVHVSNPRNRESIQKYGLKTSVGDCYSSYVGGTEKCIPAIFATNSTEEEQIFDSTWDDDIWYIYTDVANVKWFKDAHFNDDNHPEYGFYKHIVTFEDIPKEVIKLHKKGTGKDKW
jgi:hypothetical protein